MHLKYFLIPFSIFTILACSSENEPKIQTTTKDEKLLEMAKKFKEKDAIQKKEAIAFAKLHNIPLRKELADGRVMELQKIENGIPMYYSTSQNKRNHSDISTK